MTAITRSAWRTPSSISRVSSEASETECSGTLRTSMAGTGMPSILSGLVGDDDRPDLPQPGHGVDDPVEAGDHGRLVGALHEAAHRVDLRPHRPAGEVPVVGVGLHLRE